MDKLDPLLVNLLAAHRPVLTLDLPGVGLSTGPAATTVAQAADQVLAFLAALGLPSVDIDVLGFSLGGMVAQLVALNADPTSLRVRRLILAGTAPSAGEGVIAAPEAARVAEVGATRDVGLETFKELFFPRTEEGAAAAEAWWGRIHERSKGTNGGEEVATWVSQGYEDGAEGLKAQGSQIGTWAASETTQGREGSFERLGGWGWVLQQRLPNAQLIIYPKSGHGFLFQYAELFAKHALTFLEA
ncbi:Alpha/Beta hydrolase protein [Schizothecium vesticola]|uniref:Alpha/Beta hydrolase protein n=1 Tax=Schizothecium vesticola TaxID=314040 RepID=A0AA40EHT2_9PEZI|nr:Alpha/Beta hydrolase protein [Schizothecium vesticola]